MILNRKKIWTEVRSEDRFTRLLACSTIMMAGTLIKQSVSVAWRKYSGYPKTQKRL